MSEKKRPKEVSGEKMSREMYPDPEDEAPEYDLNTARA